MKSDAEYLWKMSGTFLFHCFSEMEYEMFERWRKLLDWCWIPRQWKPDSQMFNRKHVSDFILPI